MVEKPINQRIKFLLKELALSARDFSRAIGVADNNTQNYLEPRFAQPKADYLEKVMLHFGSINSEWLLTGNGEPFLLEKGAAPEKNTARIKNNSGNSIGTNHGKATQQQGSAGGENAALALAQKEIQLLREQLAGKDAVIAAKDETIMLLRGSYQNPN